MKKVRIPNRRTKRRLIEAFIETIVTRDSFLMAGHQNPDEDCMASMVAFSLLLAKFSKPPTIILKHDQHERFPYLLSICKYNSIGVIDSAEDLERAGDRFDTVMVFDTPKPSMMEFGEALRPIMDRDAVRTLEIDHHLEADGEYIGDAGYCLVDEASSTCELIGDLAVKLDRRKALLRRHHVGEIFSRNFVLAIVTGIVGDSKMGQFLKSRREKRYYRYFSRLFNDMLIQKTEKNSGNFSSIQDILNELEKLSEEEDECYADLVRHKQFRDSIAWIALDEEQTAPFLEKYDQEVIVTVAKYAANELAEESGYVSLVAYYDRPDVSDLIQIRMRRSQNYRELDLRSVIAHFGIENGGGHQGAVGFRLPRNQVPDYPAFIQRVIDETARMISGT